MYKTPDKSTVKYSLAPDYKTLYSRGSYTKHVSSLEHSMLKGLCADVANGRDGGNKEHSGDIGYNEQISKYTEGRKTRLLIGESISKSSKGRARNYP